MKIGENIKEYRLKKDISRKDLAKEIGVSEVTISRYETGSRKPNNDALVKIARVLDINVGTLFAENVEQIELFDEKYPNLIQHNKLYGVLKELLNIVNYSLEREQISNEGDCKYIITTSNGEKKEISQDSLDKLLDETTEFIEFKINKL